MVIQNKPSKKKVVVPVSPQLQNYLERYGRTTKLPLQYDDLLRYEASVPVLDLKGNDTFWETVYYQESDRIDIYPALTYIYALLKTDGDMEVLEHLKVARVDYCTFGNTKPFRIRIINELNDNYDHFYVKRSDANRVYGLELEELLSPNSVRYLHDGGTLIEEHIAGIPGDDFLKNYLDDSVLNQTRMAKEFVKFNERCFVRLLGDMRAYNYVVDITPDIEGFQYRIRAIDFDQQSYEGRKSFYLPQYFKENNPLIFLGIKHMSSETVKQYQLEERSLIAARIKAERSRFDNLFKVMASERLSTPAKVRQLADQLGYHHRTDRFKTCQTMGQIVLTNLDLLLHKGFKQSVVDVSHYDK